MVQMQTYLKVADNTGAKELMCFRVLGGTRKRYANIGDVVVCSVKKAAPGGSISRWTAWAKFCTSVRRTSRPNLKNTKR